MITDKYKYLLTEYGKRHILFRSTAPTKRKAVEYARNDANVLQRLHGYGDMDGYILPINSVMCIDLPDTYQRIYIRALSNAKT